MNLPSENFPPRPAWTEIDLGKLRRNLQLIRGDLPRSVQLMAVVKDEAYGHGALDVARVAVEEGAWGFGLSTLEEAMTLRDAGITAPLLLLGERQAAELEWCVAHDLTVCVNRNLFAEVGGDFGEREHGMWFVHADGQVMRHAPFQFGRLPFAEQQQRRGDARVAQRHRFFERAQTEAPRAFLDRDARHVERAVPVSLVLHDGHQLHAARQVAPDELQVAAQLAEVDLGPRRPRRKIFRR